MPVRSGSDQMPWWPGLHDRAELELLAGGVLGGQADVGLDDGDLALAHDEHLAQLDLHEERVEQVRAVEQRVVLQADAAAVVEERLVVLVVVVQVVLRPQHGLDDLDRRAPSASSIVGDVAEAADAAGDVARRRALERGDDADDVAVALRRDVDDLERRRRRPGRPPLRSASETILPKTCVAGDDDEADRVDRRGGAGGQHRALHAALAAVGEERRGVGEAAELGLGTPPTWRRSGSGVADLGDDEADVVRRDLHPGVALDLEDRPQLEPQPGHQQVGLVAGLAVEGEQLVVLQLRCRRAW